MRLVIALSFFLFAIGAKANVGEKKSPSNKLKCEMSILLRISKNRIKASFASVDNNIICISKYKFKNFPVNFKKLADTVLIENSRQLNKVKDLIKDYPNTKRVTLFDDYFKDKKNYFEFKNNINKMLKSSSSIISTDYIKKALEYDFRLSTEKYFKRKRTGIILTTNKANFLKGINNYAELKSWNELKNVQTEKAKKKFTHYSTKKEEKTNLFKLNNSSQNIFISAEDLFEDKFFLDKKTKIVKATLNNIKKISRLRSKELQKFIQEIPKSNIYFYRLNWEKYYFILNI